MALIEEIKTLIYEMAFERNKAESRVTELGLPVLHHLIKILKWDDKNNYSKHIYDINNWLFQIQDITIKKKGKRFKPEQYYLFLFNEQIKSVEDITKKINRSLREYKQLPEINSDVRVYQLLTQVYQRISLDLSKDQFEGIEKYL
ncbi:hypothetical protein [Chromatium okenii]|jgi:hypothetical protein|uniref:hypothetical protein n=1 Tax=Chromatium okenii TaxID=61644 RepID=UPI0026EC7B09|nr:hypothetical protein [Chromatium okenii]MBV5309985.1 hypothetical protein [Chromatium okenii]